MLDLPVRTPAGELSLGKAVTIDVHYIPSIGAPHALRVSWSPNGTTAIPTFHGTMVAEATSQNACRILLCGTYEPPGGIVGALFDALVGRRIAKRTVRAFLKRLGALAEAEYRTRMAM